MVQMPPPRYGPRGILRCVRGLQAQRERAVEARVLEAEGREEKASRREQSLLDRERQVLKLTDLYRDFSVST